MPVQNFDLSRMGSGWGGRTLPVRPYIAFVEPLYNLVAVAALIELLLSYRREIYYQRQPDGGLERIRTIKHCAILNKLFRSYPK
jgi:hypothetical protein